jgi:predicted HTH transcriptional regulator
MGEQAGSGIPRMLENWKSQHYRPPELIENVYPEYTTTRLRTLSLLPEFVRIELRERFGDSLDRLGENERLALATAMIEGYVSNGRLRQITKLHPRDITLLLSGLVADNMLDTDGKGRGTTYRVKRRSSCRS